MEHHPEDFFVEGSGVFEVGVGADRATRVKLALAGTPAHRPFVRNLRVIVT